MFVRDHISKGDIVVEYIDTSSNLADLLTKPVLKNKLQVFRSGLNLIADRGSVEISTIK